MKIFLDANVIIDIISQRNKYGKIYQEALYSAGPDSIYMSTLSIHIAYYVLRIKKGSLLDKNILALAEIINLVSLDRVLALDSIDCYLNDFEDAIQYFSAVNSGCKYIVTRDEKDFMKLAKKYPKNIQIGNSFPIS